jgi:hypothetical protein
MPRGVTLRLPLLVLVGTVLILIAARADRPDVPPPPVVAAPTDGVRCFRQGGVAGYCRCLDRLELARGGGPAGPGLPSFKDPRIRYALAHPRDYPVITLDTPRCLQPPTPTPAPDGTPA